MFGLPRSGATLVEQVLASHSRVHGAGELRLARETFQAIPVVLGRSGEDVPGCLPALDAAAVSELSRRRLERLAALLEREPYQPRAPPDRGAS